MGTCTLTQRIFYFADGFLANDVKWFSHVHLKPNLDIHT